MKQDYRVNEIVSEFPSLQERAFLKRGRFIDLDLNNTALLILDMQNYFLNENSHAFLPAGKQLIQTVSDLAHFANAKKIPVIKTQHLDVESNSNLMTSWWRNSIQSGSDECSLCDEIDKLDAELVIKSQYDAFYETELSKILKYKGIKQIIFTGISTHLCVDSTIRSAFIQGFLPILPVNGTAAFTKDQHLNSVKNLEHGFAVLSTINHLKVGMEKL